MSEPIWYRNIDNFVKLPIQVMSITDITDKDGVVIPFSAADKLVYCYMLSRIRYFCWECKGEYFDKQEDMAKELGIGLQVVRRSIKKLVDCDVLIGKKIRREGRLKWVFSNIKDIRHCAIKNSNPFVKSAMEVTAHEQEDNTLDESKNTFDFPPAF